MTDTIDSPLVSADELATHLNISADEIDGTVRAHLAQLSAAAQAYVFGFCGPFSAPDDPDAGDVPTLPDDVKQAIMMVAAHLYMNREATIAEHLSTVPIGVHELIGPYRQWAF